MRKSIFAATVLIGAVASTFALGQNLPGHVLGSPTGGGMSSGMTPTGPSADDYTMGLRLMHREEYAQAIPYLERAFVTRSHSADILNDLGLAHRKLGQYSTSMGFIRQALKEDPNSNDAHENLGELYLNLHDLASAQGQLAELTRLCPSGCDDRDALQKSIVSFEAAYPNQAAAPAPINRN
jgi:tetratricopeptide (TPR) repeat protein